MKQGENKIYYTDRCANPECNTPDEELKWNIDSFINNSHDMNKRMSFILCSDCFDKYDAKKSIVLQNQIDAARRGNHQFSLRTH